MMFLPASPGVLRRSVAACLMLLATLGGAALAQSPSASLRESTDPDRAAAILQKAQALKAAKAREAALPRMGQSAELVRGVSAGGFAFLSGGITVDDRAQMRAERQRFSLWVATVAQPSGAYLSDAVLRVTDLKTRQGVLDAVMDGPWFLVALPPGRYEVQATLQTEGMSEAQTLRSRVTVPPARPGAEPRQAVFRFAADVDVSPDIDPSDRVNPFAASPKKP